MKSVKVHCQTNLRLRIPCDKCKYYVTGNNTQHLSNKCMGGAVAKVCTLVK